MNIKLTSNEASEAQVDVWDETQAEGADGLEVWEVMHDAADDEPGRLVREVYCTAHRALAHIGMEYDGDVERAVEAFDQAQAAALANPVARAFLEGE